MTDRPAPARILKRLGLDCCCGGNRSLVEAYRSHDLDPATVGEMLDAHWMTDNVQPVHA